MRNPLTTDDREREEQQQRTLDVGQDCLATADREPRIAGSARFADDSPEPPDPGRQAIVSTEGDREQRTLGGGTAATVPEWSG